MKGKITLITPPDFFENDTYSILFMHLGDQDQEKVSEWLAKSSIDVNINIYFYSGENDLQWLLHALALCPYKYIDLDNLNDISQKLSGYIVGKSGVFYKTDDQNTSAIYHYINQNRTTQIESFLTRAFNDQISI
jgi:hypothetical protein